MNFCISSLPVFFLFFFVAFSACDHHPVLFAVSACDNHPKLGAPPGLLSGELVGLMTWWFEFDTRLRRTFFQVYFRLSPLLKHVRKVIGDFLKKVVLVLVHSQLSRTCLIGTLAYQEIDEKIDVNRKSSGISGVWRTSIVCNR